LIHVGNTNSYDRLPGLWHADGDNTNLYITYDQYNTAISYHDDVPLPSGFAAEIGQEWKIHMSMQQTDSSCTINCGCTGLTQFKRLDVPGPWTTVHTQAYTSCVTSSLGTMQKVYFGDPWYAAPLVKARNFCVSYHSRIRPPPLPPAPPPDPPGPPCEYKYQWTDTWLDSDDSPGSASSVYHELGTITVEPTYLLEWEVQFKSATAGSNWPNMIHVGSDSDGGHRIPGLWHADNDNTNFYVAYDQANSAVGHFDDVPVPSGFAVEIGQEWRIHLSLQKTLSSCTSNCGCTGLFKLKRIDVAGSDWVTAHTRDFTSCVTTALGTQQKVYFGDPWYMPPLERARKFCISYDPF